MEEVAQALAAIETESGTSLLALTEASPVLLVFLRHFGCSFCRQAISQVASLRGELEARGVRPVFVHLGTPEIAKANFEYYKIGDVERINDPGAAVYHHPVFALRRTSWVGQAFKPAVWKGWFGGALKDHGIGKIEADANQMPGTFFLKGPKIVRSFVNKTIADQPDYLALVR